MQQASLTPLGMLRSLWGNRALVAALTQREVLGRYRGSFLGILWSLFHPLFMLAIYTFLFSVVFQARWSAASESKVEFALVLFAGLIAFNLFAECVNRAPGLMLANVNYVKKVVFPLEVLPVVALGAAVFHAVVSFVVWLVFYVAYMGAAPATVLLLPLVLLPLVLGTLGVTWILASLGVFLRDLAHGVGVVTTALLFASPVFFPLSALPPAYQELLRWNPLTHVIEQARDVMVWGVAPSAGAYALQLAVAVALACAGFAWFQKARRGFADVV
jgi:lipopolysaccharide transport system permease protein